MRCRAEFDCRYRQQGKTGRHELREHGERIGAVCLFNLAGSQFDGESRGEFRCDPLADGKNAGFLRGKPGLHAFGFGLVSQGRNKQRSVEIARQ